MIVKIANAFRLLTPALFIGYAVYANASLFLNDETRLKGTDDLSLMEGGLTREFEEIYKTSLPHRAPAVGLLGAARYLALGVGKKGVIVGDDEWFFTEEEFGPDINSEPLIDRSVAEIAAVRNELGSRNIKLVVVPLPQKSDIYSEHLGSISDTSNAISQYRHFVSRLQSQGIEVVDTRSTMMSAKAEGQVFFKTDTHWTPLGAEKVAAAIEQEMILPADIDSKSFKLFSAEDTSFWGDLVNFVTGSDYGELAGINQEHTRIWRAEEEVADNSAVDLFGSDESFPVVLIGTSYSADTRWSFAEFLKKDLKADVLNLAEKAKGPGAPMYAFLQGEVLRDSPPEVVIWEFPTRYLAQKGIWDTKPQSDGEASVGAKTVDLKLLAKEQSNGHS
ncbi:alginate O-acetyltransferase AlgX-related protein [Cohaesibacter haloalkalitolerans]|uniref:alginate O-acetyltransferase AlgX-related protein n=1 Tax=Cohaesibacter haloalkalitolerans TaxID=1162980 RepID=UPI000E649AC7|nr:hypothetical protein [Cohaesibacter haloalkalitolerans]